MFQILYTVREFVLIFLVFGAIEFCICLVNPEKSEKLKIPKG
jgi:hypothetical protein